MNLCEFSQLKQNYQYPDLYIWNHFSQIKNEIDLSANNFLLNRYEDEPNTKQIIEIWISMIKSIDEFQTECYNHLPIQFSNDLLAELNNHLPLGKWFH